MQSGHSPTQQRLFAGSKPSMASSTTDSTQPRISKTSADLAPRRSPSHNGSVFRNPNWGSDTTQRRGLNQAHLSQCSPGSIGSSRSFALSPSPTSFTPTNNLGSVHEPIELDEDDNPCVPECPLPASEQASDFGGASDFCLPLPNQEFESQEGFSDSDDEEDIIDLSGSVRQNKMRRFSVADSDVIELEGWAELKDTIPDGMEVICLEDVYQEDSKSQSKHRASKSAKFERRNPSIVAPYNVHESFLYQKTELRRNKTVELQNGEFLRIKDIIQNSRTNEVKLRGHRLQRTRYLNGLLESKINEVVLFLEVDLDDPRDPLEQGAVEIPVVEVKRLRQARFTNQKFPDCRNMELSDFRGNLDAAEFGGLTVRWKYTCKYETAANRYHNIFKERILERIKPEECLPRYALPDEQRRKHWRGETILGGSYRPMVDREAGHALPTEEDLIERLRELGARKRKYSVGSGEVNALAPTPKRVRYGEKEVEDTRKRLSNVHLGDSNQQEPAMIDLCLSDSDIDELPLSQASSKQTPKPPTPSRLPIIDLSDFPLSEPSPKLDVPPRPRNPIYRTANQTFTYGDAFCGAGGSTRGALLAGLRPKWGFDFFVHAAASWRANFPLGSCFNLDAHSFITSIKSSPAYHEAFKVDILHLSPPCQYFSPAHTIEGVDDEQNVASLFAVLECIKVARPRVVTLEQTFGIMCSRFRWFFNSLINMFTSQDFSVRWAVVPLVHWVCSYTSLVGWGEEVDMAIGLATKEK